LGRIDSDQDTLSSSPRMAVSRPSFHYDDGSHSEACNRIVLCSHPSSVILPPHPGFRISHLPYPHYSIFTPGFMGLAHKYEIITELGTLLLIGHSWY